MNNNQCIIELGYVRFRSTISTYASFLLVLIGGLQTAELMAQATGLALPPSFSEEIYTARQAVDAGFMVPNENWGLYTLHNLRAGLVADKELYLTGQPVCVTICLSNTSTRVLKFSYPDDKWPWEYDFIVTRNNGQKVSHTSAAELYIKKMNETGNFGGFRGFNMKPGDTYLVKDCISEHYDISSPGEYEIIAEYPVPNWKIPDKVPLRSGVIRIHIVTQESQLHM